jgi:hypothetical protein
VRLPGFPALLEVVLIVCVQAVAAVGSVELGRKISGRVVAVVGVVIFVVVVVVVFVVRLELRRPVATARA